MVEDHWLVGSSSELMEVDFCDQGSTVERMWEEPKAETAQAVVQIASETLD